MSRPAARATSGRWKCPDVEPHRTVVVERSLLGRNAARAERNRTRFSERGIAVVNVLSSPGSGKTALLARSLGDLAPRVRAAVVVGDVATDNDARRLAAAGVEVVQVTTGGVCHLEAGMVARAVERLDLEGLDLLDRKSTRLNSSHLPTSRMPSSA